MAACPAGYQGNDGAGRGEALTLQGHRKPVGESWLSGHNPLSVPPTRISEALVGNKKDKIREGQSLLSAPKQSSAPARV